MFKRLFYFIVGILFLLASCHSNNKSPLVNSMAKPIDSCACSPDILSPPPPFNYSIAADTIIYRDSKRVNKFYIRLVSDKTVDFEGETMQLFKVRLKSERGIDSFDFSLPVRYNRYWNKLHIYRDTLQKAFYIGFKREDSFNTHLIYSFRLDTLPFNKRLILKNYIEMK
jgi:hypothetical protein